MADIQPAGDSAYRAISAISRPWQRLCLTTKSSIKPKTSCKSFLEMHAPSKITRANCESSSCCKHATALLSSWLCVQHLCHDMVAASFHWHAHCTALSPLPIPAKSAAHPRKISRSSFTSSLRARVSCAVCLTMHLPPNGCGSAKLYSIGSRAALTSCLEVPKAFTAQTKRVGCPGANQEQGSMQLMAQSSLAQLQKIAKQ